MKELLEDYQRKLKEVNKLILEFPDIEKIKIYDWDTSIYYAQAFKRLTTKASCYRTFIAELERIIAQEKIYNP